MEFQVPQFIEVEDRIFGPLTLKQGLYLGGGIGAAIALYLYIPYKFLGIMLGVPILAFAATLAFYKVNGRTFTNTLESAVYYFSKEKLYLWKKADKKVKQNTKEEVFTTKSNIVIPKISESKLKDLTWSLDIKEDILSENKRQ
jgi:hypothetical protein